MSRREIAEVGDMVVIKIINDTTCFRRYVEGDVGIVVTTLQDKTRKTPIAVNFFRQFKDSHWVVVGHDDYEILKTKEEMREG